MFCRKCGQEIHDEAVICPHCGCSTGYNPNVNNSNTNGIYNNDDSTSTGWMVLGIFFPVIALILYFVWKNEKPLRASSLIKGAIIGFIVSIVLSVISSIAMGSFFGSLMYYFIV